MSVQATLEMAGRSFALDHLTDSDCIFNVWQNTRRFYESALLERIRACAVPGVYVDVGANVGNHSVVFSALCPSTLVVCVEPFAAVHGMLAANMTRHCDGKPWLLVPFAAMPTCGRVRMEGYHEGNWGKGIAHAYADGTAWGLPFDRIYRNFPADVLKLDIEGMELEALRQIAEYLQPECGARRPKLIAVERVSPTEYADCDAFLRPFGYTCDGVDLAKPYAPVYLWERTA